MERAKPGKWVVQQAQGQGLDGVCGGRAGVAEQSGSLLNICGCSPVDGYLSVSDRVELDTTELLEVE